MPSVPGPCPSATSSCIRDGMALKIASVNLKLILIYNYKTLDCLRREVLQQVINKVDKLIIDRKEINS
ncbi:hypothetical protein HBH77_143590 [Parastagonospora nodorum]|nr:hypothetical protein HBH77_143590 [Parastagonospora nodorum]